MKDKLSFIPTRIAYLMIGYFHETLSDEENIELDVWVTAADEHQTMFERCLAMTQRPRGSDPYNENESELYYVAGLIVKYLQDKTTSIENAVLEAWVASSKENKKLFDELPRSPDMEVLYKCLVTRTQQHKRSN